MFLLNDRFFSLILYLTFHLFSTCFISSVEVPIHPHQVHCYLFFLIYSHKILELPVAMLSTHFFKPSTQPTSLNFTSSFCFRFIVFCNSIKFAKKSFCLTILDSHFNEIGQIPFLIRNLFCHLLGQLILGENTFCF